MQSISDILAMRLFCLSMALVVAGLFVGVAEGVHQCYIVKDMMLENLLNVYPL